MIRTFIRGVMATLVVTLAACGGGSNTCVDVAGGNACSGNGSGGTPAPVASDLVLSLSASTLPNNGTQSVQATAIALDGNRNTVAAVPVTISVDNGAVATASGPVTGSEGSVTATIGIGSDRSNRTINVTATSGSLSRTAQLFVVDAGGGGGIAVSDIVLTLGSPTISNDGTETVVATAIALAANRNVLSGVPVVISASSNAVVVPNSLVTDPTGRVTAGIGIGSDTSNRTITVTAVGGGIARSVPLVVSDAGTSGVPSDLVLTLSSGSIANNGSQTVTATAVALDAKRNTMAGIPVSVTVNSNAIATPSGSTTGANGSLTAAIGIGNDQSNRTIEVKATAAGGLERKVDLLVTDAATSGPPVAADLSLVLSAATLDNGGTNTILATVTAVDANRNVLQGIPVTVRVDSSAVAAVSGSATSAQGVVTARVGIGSDRTNRVITVTATSGTLTRSESFSVIGARLSASFAPVVTASSAASVEYALLDTNSLPMVKQSITVEASNGVVSSGVTDPNGKYRFDYTAPASEGALTITASAAGVSRVTTIQVSSGSIAAVDASLQIRSASLTPTPSVVAANVTASSENQSELRGLFVGANTVTGQDNVPIPRVRARFRILNNADGSLGSLSWVGGNYAIADENGIARATYRPGTRSSPTDGVTVEMCWDRVDFPIAETCTANSARATLTVVDEALSVSIRTNELIKSGAANLTYIKEFVVMVVDASGQAKADVQITPSIDLTGYYKGFWVFNQASDLWERFQTVAATEEWEWDGYWKPASQPKGQPVCPNEDVNRNGVRDATSIGSGAPPAVASRAEDLNWNGELDPRKADVAIKTVGSSKTDQNGLAVVQIEYGRDLASWVDFVITVTASGISGTEARARYVGNRYGVGNLPYPGDAINDEAVAPAFVISPYGRGDWTFDGNGNLVPLGVCTDTK